MPPLYFFTMVLSQAALLSEGVTPWDRACGLQVACGKVDRGRIFMIIGLFFALGAVVDLSIGDAVREAVEALKPSQQP